MSEYELAWLAGFWDGEGSVGLVKNKATRILSIQLAHTEVDSVMTCLQILEGHGVSGRGYTYQERNPARHRDAHYIRISGIANGLRFARLVLPYAITKKRHWEIVIAWAESRIALAGGIDSAGHLFRGGIGSERGYSAADLALAEELSTLNRRGPRDRQERREGRIRSANPAPEALNA